MYPAEQTTTVEVVKRTDVLCGQQRPGHFAGVATVLMKLFNITVPTRAYFGMKDAQQVAVIEGFVTDFNIPVTIVPVDIVREEDGLAKVLVTCTYHKMNVKKLFIYTAAYV